MPVGPINEPAKAPNAVPAIEPTEPPTFCPVLLFDSNSVPTPAAALNIGIVLLALNVPNAPRAVLRRNNDIIPAFCSVALGITPVLGKPLEPTCGSLNLSANWLAIPNSIIAFLAWPKTLMNSRILFVAKAPAKTLPKAIAICLCSDITVNIFSTNPVKPTTAFEAALIASVILFFPIAFTMSFKPLITFA